MYGLTPFEKSGFEKIEAYVAPYRVYIRTITNG